MAIKSLSIRIDEEMLDKLHCVADYEGRSANSQIIILIRDAIEKYEEKATSSFLYTIYCLARAQSGSDDLTSNEGKIFLAEQSAIKNFAERGRAIFLGHCAAEALKDKPHTVKVFIRGDEDDKKQRIVRDYGIDEDRVEETMHHIDKRRAGYYYANTACRFDDINSYDLILNSSVLGIDGCVKILKTLF